MPTDSPDDLAGRVRVLEDRLEIHQLYVHYGTHLDAGDFAAYAALFADDGEVLLGPLGRAQGPAAIRGLLERTIADQAAKTIHLITSPAVVLDGDRATGTAMWTVLAPGPDGRPVVTMNGRHHDEFVRTPDGWRFRRRAGTMDLPAAYGG